MNRIARRLHEARRVHARMLPVEEDWRRDVMTELVYPAAILAFLALRCLLDGIDPAPEPLDVEWSPVRPRGGSAC